MDKQDFIQVDVICSHYEIEFSFIEALDNNGLLKIELLEQKKFIHQNRIGDLEKMIRIHHELNVNIEGIDVVFNLLEREIKLREEVNVLKNRLLLYEND